MILLVLYTEEGKPLATQNKKYFSIIVGFISKKTRNDIYRPRSKLRSVEFNDPHTDKVFINDETSFFG